MQTFLDIGKMIMIKIIIILLKKTKNIFKGHLQGRVKTLQVEEHHFIFSRRNLE